MPAYIRALNHEEVMRGRRVSELRLTAREEREAATAAPGANPAVPGPGAGSASPPRPPASPARYVEFNLVALRTPEPKPAKAAP